MPQDEKLLGRDPRIDPPLDQVFEVEWHWPDSKLMRASRYCIVCHLQIFPGENCPHLENPLILINAL